jgi:hypothetical protein
MDLKPKKHFMGEGTMVYFRAVELESRKENLYTYTIEHKKSELERSKIIFKQLNSKVLTLYNNKTVANIVAIKDHVVLVMRACERYIVYDNSKIKEFFSLAQFKAVYDIVSVYEIYFTKSFEDVPGTISLTFEPFEPQYITVE